MKTILSMHDFHIPYHDKKAVNVAIMFAKHLKPTVLILHEVIDFYTLSKFNKDPRRITSLQKDLDKTYEILSLIRNALPKTRIIMVESNHDKRLKKYKFSKAQELAYLRNLTIEKLMRLDELNIEYKKYFIYKNILFKHGDIVRKDSSQTAKAELLKEGMSGASGHSHRLGQCWKTLRGGKYVWVEGGCLCKLNPEYIEGTADWQHGLSLFMFPDDKNLYDSKAVLINNYKIIWGSRVFK